MPAGSLGRLFVLRRQQPFWLQNPRDAVMSPPTPPVSLILHSTDRSQDAHALVRESVVAQLRRQPGMYQEYVPQEYRGYCDDMAQPQAWGDHVTLQAAADCLGLRIALVTSFPDTAFLEIAPRGVLRSSRVLWLSFWAEVHYNSIYPKGEAPALFMGPSAMPMSQPGRSQAKFLGSKRLHHLLIG